MTGEKLKPAIVKGSSLKEAFLPEGCFLFENWGAATSGVKNVSIARARIEPCVTTKVHWLTGVREIYLIVQGKGKVTVGDLKPTEVSECDVVVIPPETAQSITNLGETDLIFYCICTPAFVPECYHDNETNKPSSPSKMKKIAV
jgi:mannose-6-phosphate isomerase-like protein (cupin superfamily)